MIGAEGKEHEPILEFYYERQPSKFIIDVRVDDVALAQLPYDHVHVVVFLTLFYLKKKREISNDNEMIVQSLRVMVFIRLHNPMGRVRITSW